MGLLIVVVKVPLVRVVYPGRGPEITNQIVIPNDRAKMHQYFS